MGTLEHMELAPRGGGGLAAPAPGAPDLLAELENVKTPPVPGRLQVAVSSFRRACSHDVVGVLMQCSAGWCST